MAISSSDLSQVSEILKGDNQLSVFHLNAQSLKNKFDYVQLFLTDLSIKFDLLCFSETWFTPDYECFPMAGYDCISICRSNARGGGIAIYIRDDLPYDVLADFKVINDDYECIAVQCYGILFALCYRPPSGVLNNFLDFSEKCSN